MYELRMRRSLLMLILIDNDVEYLLMKLLYYIDGGTKQQKINTCGNYQSGNHCTSWSHAVFVGGGS